MNNIKEKIEQRRRQMLVHSFMYYRLNDSIISDSTWSRWAVELDHLQKEYPDLAAQAAYAESFQNFDPSSGFDLDLDDPWIEQRALYLLMMKERKQNYDQIIRIYGIGI